MKPTVKPSVKAMRHQLISLKHDEKNPVVYDTSEPGTGKTFVRILAFAKRHAKNGKRALVLAPRSLLRAVWAKDFKKFAPNIRVSVAFAENREKAFAADADVYVTNHDAVKWLVRKPAGWFRKMNFDELIVDEITAYKHGTSQRSKALKTIAKRFSQRKGMTGTPNTVSITDIWHQVLVLDGGERLGGSFFAFRDACCNSEKVDARPKLDVPAWIAERVGMSGTTSDPRSIVKWVDKPGIEEVVFAQIGDIVVRHMLDDCADIPPNHHYSIPFEMPAKQLRVYSDMEAAKILEFIDGEDKKKITAVNAAAVRTKLLQIASGAVYTGEADTYKVLDETRYEMVIDLAMERRHPLIFFFWKHQRDLLAKHAKAAGMTFEIVDGNSSDAHRAETELRYQNGLLDAVFAHPKIMAHGFTLTRGTSTIWASPTDNLEWYDQGSRRQRRIGQKHKTETVTVLADVPVERAVYEDLQRKDGRMTSFLSLIHAMTKEYA